MRPLRLLVGLALALTCACADASARPTDDASPGDVADGAADADADADVDAAVAANGPDLAAWRRQVLYLVMPDRFDDGDAANNGLGVAGCFDRTAPAAYHGGDLAGLARRVGHLGELGVSALWTTPVYQQAAGPAGRCPYHGYWPDYADPDEGHVEPRLGGDAALAALRAALTAADIRYVFDVVVNHTGDRARLVTQRPEWFHDPSTCAALGDPTVTCPWRPDSPDFAQERAEVATYLSSLTRGWVERHAPDALRVDAVKHVPPSYFQTSFLPTVRGARGNLFVVAELFSSDLPLIRRYLDAGFDSAFAFSVRDGLVNTFAKAGSVDAIAGAVQANLAAFGLDRTLRLVTFLDNHDLPRFVNLPGFGIAPAEIERRYHLALVALFTTPGIPQLYYGDEVALYGGADPDNRRDMPAWAWDQEGRSAPHATEAAGTPQRTFALVRDLIRVRRTNAAFADGRYVELWRQNGAGQANVWAYLRLADQARALVVMNADGQARTVNIPLTSHPGLGEADRAAFADGTALDDVLGRGAPVQVVVTGGIVSLELPAQTAAIYVVRP